MTDSERGPRWAATARAIGWLSALLLGCGLLLADPPWLQTLRYAMFDQFQRWHPRVYQDTAVRIVDVDEESLNRLGQWPWPRTRMAELVELATRGNAAAIGFDVIFAERDRTSPQLASQQWALSAGQRAAFAALPDHDTVFAQAMDHARVVLGVSMLPAPVAGAVSTAGTPAPSVPMQARFVEVGAPAAPFLPVFGGTVGAVQPLAAHAAGHGALAFLPDSDGVVRRVPMLLRSGDQLVPSLLTEMLRVSQDERNVVVRSISDGLQQVRIGALAIPTTASGELWVHYTPPAPTRTIPAWKLLEGQVPPQELNGKLLLLGTSATGLMDLRFGTLGQVVPGVEVHAQALEQVLTGQTLARPGWARALEVLCLLFGGAAVGVLALRTGPAIAASATVLVLAGLGAAAWWAFRYMHVLLDPLTPSLGVAAAFMAPSLHRHHMSEQRRRWVSQAFSRYVSPNLVAHIVQHPEQLALGGDRRCCSFLFSDLAGFTGLMERIDPAAAVGLLNNYLDGMISIAFRHQGTLDRIVGDGIAIMFSAPVPQADHRERALACAIELQRFATAFAGRQQSGGVSFGHTRIGVHCGEVIVGNFGGGTIFDYRALGDPVNTASRLEAANKHLGTRLCVSEDMLVASAGLAARCAGRLVFKGKSKPLKVFQPAHNGLDLPADRAAISRYEAAYALMAQHDPGALAAFEALALDDATEPLVQLHLERLRRGEQGDILTLTEK